METNNITEAVNQVYDVKNRRMANAMSGIVMNQKGTKKELQSALKREGLTSKQISEVRDKIIKAATSKESLKHARPKDAIALLDMENKLQNRYPPKKVQVASASVNYKFQGQDIKNLDPGSFVAMLEKMNENIESLKEELNDA